MGHGAASRPDVASDSALRRIRRAHVPSQLRLHRTDHARRGPGRAGRSRRRGQSARRRAESHPADEAPVRAAADARRHQPDPRVGHDRRSQRLYADRRAGPAQRRGGVGRRTTDESHRRARRALDLRPARAQPRHSLRLACGASVVAKTSRGERVIPMTELITGVFSTQLDADELVTEVRVPRYAGPSGGTYLKLERKVGDYATVGVATHLTLDESGRIAAAGVALTAVGPTNIKAIDAEQAILGATPDADAFRAAGRLAAAAADPRDDVRGSAEYKRHVVDVFVQRGLATAAQIATASASGQA